MSQYRYFENILRQLANSNCTIVFTLTSILSLCFGFDQAFPDMIKGTQFENLFLPNQPCCLIFQLKSNTERSFHEARR